MNKALEREGAGNKLKSDERRQFGRAADAAIKSRPKHRVSLNKKERPASKGRVHKGRTRS
jgi:hypothetical protein